MLFRLVSSSSLGRLRTVVASSHSVRYMSETSGSPSLKDKALKAMLNSANPKNINGEEDTPTKDSPIKPAPLVFEAPKPKTSVTGSVGSTETKAADKLKTEAPLVKPPAVNPVPDQQQQQKPQQLPKFGMPALHEFAPKIVVIGVGGAGNNALNNMIAKELHGVDFLALNTDAQHLSTSLTDQRLQMGVELTRGLGAGANPDAGRM